MFDKIQQYAKAIVSLVGAILTAGAFTLPDEVQPYVGLGMAILTAIATYAVPNKVGGQTITGATIRTGASGAPGPSDALVKGDGLGGPEHSA